MKVMIVFLFMVASLGATELNLNPDYDDASNCKLVYNDASINESWHFSNKNDWIYAQSIELHCKPTDTLKIFKDEQGYIIRLSSEVTR